MSRTVYDYLFPSRRVEELEKRIAEQNDYIARLEEQVIKLGNLLAKGGKP